MTFSFVAGVVNIEFFENAFLAFSGLGFIPSLLGAFTQTLEVITAILDYNAERILKVLAALEGGFIYTFALIGIHIRPTVSLHIGGLALAGVVASQSKYVLRDNMDTGRVEDAIHEDTPSERARLWRQRVRTVFDEMDTDQDGILQHHELFGLSLKHIRNAFLDNDVLMSKMMFNKFFAHLDEYKGTITFDHFVQAVRESDPHYHAHHDGEEGEHDGEESGEKDREAAGHSNQQCIPSVAASLVHVLSCKKSDASANSSLRNSVASPRDSSFATTQATGTTVPPVFLQRPKAYMDGSTSQLTYPRGPSSTQLHVSGLATPSLPFATPFSPVSYSPPYMHCSSPAAGSCVLSRRGSFELHQTAVNNQGSNINKKLAEDIVQSMASPIVRVGTTGFLQTITNRFRREKPTEPDPNTSTSAELLYASSRPINSLPPTSRPFTFNQRQEPPSEFGEGAWC
jgi:hypothetical protein